MFLWRWSNCWCWEKNIWAGIGWIGGSSMFFFFAALRKFVYRRSQLIFHHQDLLLEAAFPAWLDILGQCARWEPKERKNGEKKILQTRQRGAPFGSEQYAIDMKALDWGKEGEVIVNLISEVSRNEERLGESPTKMLRSNTNPLQKGIDMRANPARQVRRLHLLSRHR